MLHYFISICIKCNLGCWDYKIIYFLCRFIVKEQTIYPNQKRGIVYNILAEGNNLTRITKGVVQEYNSQVRTGYHISSYGCRANCSFLNMEFVENSNSCCKFWFSNFSCRFLNPNSFFQFELYRMSHRYVDNFGLNLAILKTTK